MLKLYSATALPFVACGALGGFVHCATTLPMETIASDAGSSVARKVTFCFAPGLEGATSLELSVDSQAIASVALPADVVLSPGQADGSGLRLGYDAGFPVCDDYEPPFPWTGEIHRVTFEPKAFKPIDGQTAVDDAVHRD